MGINLYGNINGNRYSAQEINLFDSAKTQEKKPVTVSEFFAGKDMSAISVDISEEGLKALHGSKLPGSADPFETAAKIAYMSEHQPVESFTNQFSQMMPKNYTLSESGEAVFTPHTIEEKETALVEGFKRLYDEVSKGYDDGTRVRYIEDPTSDDGYRKLTKDEELSILKMEFDDFADSRFGEEKKAQEAAIKESLREVQDILRKLGKEPVGPSIDMSEEIPERFAEKLKTSTDNYAEAHGMKLSFMRDFIENIKGTFSPMELNLQKLV